MTSSAYVLVNLSGKETRAALERIKKIKGVKSAHLVAGPFDLIIHVEGKGPEEIGELVISKIRKSPGVTNTVTCYVVA
ncbi:MAG: Lrp/AsnC ligand binding domain-containing protein [Candidatus Dadabacteria bacterium]|jgi:DNA-binding Lrp family transcriptional regulator|nr:Lrp/AsnC ligand binding domain-containing protein [Candidatus Dadabacteria bacterium]